MHDSPIVTWRNGDPTAHAFKSDGDAYTGVDDDVTQDPPLFLPLPTLPLDLDEIDLATVAPIQVVPVNVGAGNVQGASAPVQGAPDPPAEDKEIE